MCDSGSPAAGIAMSANGVGRPSTAALAVRFQGAKAKSLAAPPDTLVARVQARTTGKGWSA